MWSGYSTGEANPVALRRHRLFESADLAVTRDRISTILQPHVLRPRGGHQRDICYLDHIPINHTGVGAIRFGEMQVHVPELADYHLFIMCLEGHAAATVEREDYRIDRSRGLLVAPGEQMLASFSADCEQLFVRIGRKAVAEHSGFRRLQFKRGVDLRNPRLAPWIHHVATIISDTQTSEYIASAPHVANDYERLLLSLLLAGQDHYDAAARTAGIAPSSVRRAEEFIHANCTLPLTLAEIATAAGVPARTLLESFRRFRNTSPVRYLRDVRLDYAQKLLQDCAVTTAAQAAMDAGLMHLGRFSKEYAERFGERPSDTLRRGRQAR
jgi:AraC-like DNA-binding protein